MANLQAQLTLSGIYRIVEAGERGYATAAVNMPGQGLKILMKYYAQQRANHRQEILAELQRLGQTGAPWSSIPAIIHRGRISIFAALSEKDEREKIILKEVLLGEQIALRAYQLALKSPLPAQTSALLTRQMQETAEVREQIQLLHGQSGKILLVNLYSDESAVGTAIQTMQQTGLPVEIVQQVNLRAAGVYAGRGATILETVLSGAFGGALWGGLAGVLAGIGVTQNVIPLPVGFGALLQAGLPVALACLLAGAALSSILAFFIGASISEEDGVQLDEILQNRPILLETLVNQR